MELTKNHVRGNIRINEGIGPNQKTVLTEFHVKRNRANGGDSIHNFFSNQM